jgi:hypothetical protein
MVWRCQRASDRKKCGMAEQHIPGVAHSLLGRAFDETETKVEMQVCT